MHATELELRREDVRELRGRPQTMRRREPGGRIRSVLVAVDFSPASARAVAWAAAIAEHRGAELRLVHVAPTSEPPDVLLACDCAALQLLRRDACRRMDELVLPWRPRLPSVDRDVLIGAPAKMILAAARAHRPELVVLGTRGLRGWRHALLGSTAQRVMAAAACPVLAVHAGDAAPPAHPWRLLAAVDGSDEAANAVHEAARLLGSRVAEIELLRVLDPPLVYPPEVAAGLVAVGAHREAAEEHVAAEARTLADEGVVMKTAVVDGFAVAVIGRHAEERGVDLIVMGTHGRGRVGHLLLGSTTERVAQHASMPVLAVPRRAMPSRELGEPLHMVAAGAGDER